jgi:hypothetical protein
MSPVWNVACLECRLFGMSPAWNVANLLGMSPVFSSRGSNAGQGGAGDIVAGAQTTTNSRSGNAQHTRSGRCLVPDAAQQERGAGEELRFGQVRLAPCCADNDVFMGGLGVRSCNISVNFGMYALVAPHQTILASHRSFDPDSSRLSPPSRANQRSAQSPQSSLQMLHVKLLNYSF